MNQIPLQLLGVVGQPSTVAEYLIGRCKSEADAVAICWHNRRVKFSLRAAAGILGIPASHLSNILSGKKYLPHDFRARFQVLCGNWAIRQYEDAQICAKTHFETPDERIERLERQLAEERMRRVA